MLCLRKVVTLPQTCVALALQQGEELGSSFPSAMLARLDRHEPRGLRIVPIAFSPAERAVRFVESLCQAAQQQEMAGDS